MSNVLFFNAIRNNDIKTVETLLQQGVDPNVKDDYGRTPLQIAAPRHRTKIVEILLKYGADPNTQSPYQRPVLYFVLDEETEYLLYNWDPDLNRIAKTAEIVEHLLKYGAKVNVQDDIGRSILHCIVHDEMVDVAKLLIQHGVDVNAQDDKGNTPLDILSIFICVDAHSKLSELLISHGAKSTKKNNFMYLVGASPNYHDKDTLVTDLEEMLDDGYLNLNPPDPELQELITAMLTPRLRMISDLSDLSMTVSSLVLRALTQHSPFLVG